MNWERTVTKASGLPSVPQSLPKDFNHETVFAISEPKKYVCHFQAASVSKSVSQSVGRWIIYCKLRTNVKFLMNIGRFNLHFFVAPADRKKRRSTHEIYSFAVQCRLKEKYRKRKRE